MLVLSAWPVGGSLNLLCLLLFLLSPPGLSWADTLTTTSPSNLQPLNQIKESTASSMLVVLNPFSICYPSNALQPANSANTVFPSTESVLPPLVQLSAEQLAALSKALFTNSTFEIYTFIEPIPPTSLKKLECCPFEYPCQKCSTWGCRWFEICKQFGSCCSDATSTIYNTDIPSFECVADFIERNDKDKTLHYCWMMASCPESDLESDCAINNGISDLCGAQLLSSPPIRCYSALDDSLATLIILSCSGMSLGAVAVVILLFTYAASKMWTFHGKFFVNFALVVFLGDLTVLAGATELHCSTDRLYSCQASTPIGCRCDELCTTFGDCCVDSNYSHSNNTLKLECVSNAVLDETKTIIHDEEYYYWMIASCPEDASDIESILNGIAHLCKAQTITIPPVSDNRTGLVYRNWYCAQCHGVPEKEQIVWPSMWRCENTTFLVLASNSSGYSSDKRASLTDCNPLVFTEPQIFAEKERLHPLRECDSEIIYKCQPPTEANTSSKEYQTLRKLCQVEPGKARNITSARGIYKNEYCALCSDPNFDRNNLRCPPPKTIVVRTRGPSFSSVTILLDVRGTGITMLGKTDVKVNLTFEQSCAEGQVFDVYREKCRVSPCQLGFNYSGSYCLPVDPNCTLIALNKTEYQMISNKTIYWIALKQNVSVQDYNSKGNPLVCTNFTSNFHRTVNETITRTLHGYPAAFSILTYLGLSVDVVAAAILLFTYAAFSEMRTFYGKLFMNFVLVLLLGDLIFLLGTAVFAVSLEDVVCQVVAILLHYLFLARFMWMSLLSLNVAHHFYHAAKLTVSEKSESWHYLILYMAVGWFSPLLVLIVTVPLNYAISGTVGYGIDGLCWMNQTLATTISFIVPLAICILFTTGAFAFVCIILAKLHRSASNEDLKHKRTGFRNCRVLVAVFCTTAGMWLFGFLALIDSTLSWAWYIFIMLNTTQAVYLTLAYICTAKVLLLYRSALKARLHCCVGKDLSQLQLQLGQLELN